MKNIKIKTLLLSLTLVLLMAVGATIAYLLDDTEAVTNTFEPTEVSSAVVEEFSGSEKSNVKIENTGDIPAFIRAEVIVTWKNNDGHILGEAPVEGRDYTITWNVKSEQNQNAPWFEHNGFYYHSAVVNATEGDELTEVLIYLCEPVQKNVPEGYFLSVEIIGSAIQADGVSLNGSPTADAKGDAPAEKAWGVTVNYDENGKAVSISAPTSEQ